MSPELLAGLASLAAVLILTGINIRQGWSKASSDYVSTLRGLIEAKELQIATYQQENADLSQEIRRLERRVKMLEDAAFGPAVAPA